MTDRAYQLIEEEIVTLRLPPGAVVSETILSARLGIGRTPVREALQRLSRELLVHILPRRGIVVSDIDVVKQLRLLETRRALERLLARAAARHATPDERAAFTSIAEGMERAARALDDLEFLRRDREFNLLLLRAGRNEFTASAIGLMNGLSRRFWVTYQKEMADLPLTARLHATIALAVAAGEADAAAHATDALVDYVESVARKVLSRTAAP